MNEFFLADDLSGALDAAAAFHRAGRKVRIALRPEAWTEAAADEVVALTTETRNAAADAAAERVQSVLAAATARGARLLYKKIDSTLRGPVAAELGAVLEVLPGARVLFAPANPAVGRTVVDGVLRVHGVPVAETAFGRDPAAPLRTSVIREILGGVANERVVIPDTVTQADLAWAVREMDAAGGPWIAVGSGALAIAVAEWQARDAEGESGRGAAKSALAAAPGADGAGGSDVADGIGKMESANGEASSAPAVAASPVLMIGGSAHPLNRTQARELAVSRGVTVHEIAFGAANEAVAAGVAALRDDGMASLMLPESRVDAATALRMIVDASTATIEAAGVRRIFATGGETAYALCERLGVRTLLFLQEIEPGLALAVGYSRAGPMLLAVKPGGFGDAQTWVRALDRLRAGEHA